MQQHVSVNPKYVVLVNEIRHCLMNKDDVPHFDALRVAAVMHQREALSPAELQDIESKQDRPVETVNTMLEVLKKKPDPDLMCFLDSLLCTGQKEIHDFFYHYGKSKIQTYVSRTQSI